MHEPTEVVRTARSRQCPHILEPEVLGELVDAPRAGRLDRVREPHGHLHSLPHLPKPPMGVGAPGLMCEAWGTPSSPAEV